MRLISEVSSWLIQLFDGEARLVTSRGGLLLVTAALIGGILLVAGALLRDRILFIVGLAVLVICLARGKSDLHPL